MPTSAGLPTAAQLVLMGHSEAMERLRAQLRRIAPHFRTALITGERGTGAETIAQELHAMSPGANQPLTTASGAVDVGWADSSTLFVPELHGLSPGTQSVVLLALKRGVHVIAATEHSPKTLVAAGYLRPDLYRALSTIEIALPVLRNRLDDIAELAQAVIGDRTMSAEFLDALKGHVWTGNITELQEVLQEAMRLNGESILEKLPEALRAPQPIASKLVRLQDVIDEHVFAVLNACAGNKLRAAEVLGISRSTLYRMLESSPLARAG